MKKMLMSIRPDGLALVVKVEMEKIRADLFVARRREYLGEADEEFILEVGASKIFSQEFNITGLPWQPASNQELFADWLREKIAREPFKRFAEPIARLAQQAA